MTNTENKETENKEALPRFDELLKEEFLLAAINKLGFETASPVQAACIPLALTGKDLVVQAETGSGKTLAYSLPMLAHLKNKNASKKPGRPLSLIVSPTRELALQVVDVINDIAPELDVVTVIGGVDMDKQIRALKKTCDTVVGTPGRILDLMRQKELNLKSAGYFALDEADEMLSLGFYEDVKTILTRLPDKRQGLFVSATISPRIAMLAETFLDKPERVTVDSPESSPDSIEHLYANVPSELMAKPNAICDYIETLRPQSAIIFCNTKSDTTLVEAVMRRRGFDARRLNSDLSQSQRTRVMKKIKNRELQFLVATDVAARGLDIEQIDLVINFAIHDQPETYIHRSGRTGRAGRKGKVISLIGARDFGAFHQLKKTLEVELKECPLPSDEEVADARIAHLHETLRQAKLELTDRDNAVATKLLADNGTENPSEELVEVIAKLSRYSLEHAVSQEKKALEEELKSEEKAHPEENVERKPRQDDRRDERRRDKRESKDRREPREKRDDRRNAPRNHDDRGERREPRQKREKKEESETIRLFLNQGKSQGMDRSTFVKISEEEIGIDRAELIAFRARKLHSFIDCQPAVAKLLIENLNGFSYKDSELFLEKATTITKRKPRRDNRRERSQHHEKS